MDCNKCKSKEYCPNKKIQLIMATIKLYTDLSQSKKLAEILPIESADMFYTLIDQGLYLEVKQGIEPSKDDIRCWSLSALLGILPKEIVYDKNMVFLEFHAWENSLEYVNNADYTLYVTKNYDNPVDACVDMIIHLHELKML